MPGDFPDAETAARLKEAGTAYGQGRKVTGSCPACGSSSLFLGDGGHVTCSNVTCPRPTMAGEVLKAFTGLFTRPTIAEAATEPGEVALGRLGCEVTMLREQAERAEGFAEKAEARCIRAAKAVDVRDRHARELVDALTGGGHGLPWWIVATRSLESLDHLANSAQLEDDGETPEEAVSRVGDEARRAGIV